MADKTDTQSLTRHAVEKYPAVKRPADYALFVTGQLLAFFSGDFLKK